MTSKIGADLTTKLAIQVTTLIEDAPDDPRTIQEISRVAPLLGQIALAKLHHAHYYLIQDPEGALLRVTLAHRTQSHVEKTVIAAFSTQEDAILEIQNSLSPACLAVKTPILEILFQFWALKWCDSLIFYPTGGDRSQGVEISYYSLSNILKKEPIAAQKARRSVPKGFGKVV